MCVIFQFCLLNNVAIGAAYAIHTYGRTPYPYLSEARGREPTPTKAPIKRVVIFDFDVHHGNGTEAILRNLMPHEEVETVNLPFARAAVAVMSYKPWLDVDDGSNVLFVSTHGYGEKRDDEGTVLPHSTFYPGSGANAGWDAAAVGALGAEHTPITRGVSSVSSAAPPFTRGLSSLMPAETSFPEPFVEAHASAPHVINVAMEHGAGPKAWRRALSADVLPRVAAFKPDLIFVSAGFDAHRTDGINSGYIRLAEEDYYWVTRQLVKIANLSAHGRVVSVLEGGYRVQGGPVSALGRSVAAHVRALSGGFQEKWDEHAEAATLEREIELERAQVAASRAAAEAAARAAVEAAAAQDAAGVGRDVAGAGAGSGDAGDLMSPVRSRSKRARSAVDYVSLDASMRAAPAGEAVPQLPEMPTPK